LTLPARIWGTLDGCEIALVTVGTMLAEMEEHQLTIGDYLRHSNPHVTNKYLQATSKTKRTAQEKLVEAIMPPIETLGHRLSTEPPRGSDQKVKRPPIVGAQLLL